MLFLQNYSFQNFSMEQFFEIKRFFQQENKFCILAVKLIKLENIEKHFLGLLQKHKFKQFFSQLASPFYSETNLLDF